MPWLVEVVEFTGAGLTRQDIVCGNRPMDYTVGFERLYFNQNSAVKFQNWYNTGSGQEYPNCVPWALDPVYIDEFELIRNHNRYQRMMVMDR